MNVTSTQIWILDMGFDCMLGFISGSGDFLGVSITRCNIIPHWHSFVFKFGLYVIFSAQLYMSNFKGFGQSIGFFSCTM